MWGLSSGRIGLGRSPINRELTTSPGDHPMTVASWKRAWKGPGYRTAGIRPLSPGSQGLE